MRKAITAGLTALLLAGGGSALAGHAGTNPTDPGAIGDHPALYGLCTAWHANENGRENGKAGSAPPFAALAQAAEDNGETVSELCDGVRPGNGHGRGGDNSNAPNPSDR